MRRYHIVGLVTLLDNDLVIARDLTVSIPETCQVYDDWCRVMALFLHADNGKPVNLMNWRVTLLERLSDCEASD